MAESKAVDLLREHFQAASIAVAVAATVVLAASAVSAVAARAVAAADWACSALAAKRFDVTAG